MDYKNLNKVRVHNKKETVKHFIIKAMCLKILFNEGYKVYTEEEISKYFRDKDKKTRVADVCARDQDDLWEENKTIIVEVETRPTKKHNQELLDFYKDYNLYIIDVKNISQDLNQMEAQLRYILGM